MLALALSRPTEALAAARALLAGSPSAAQAGVAHQAMGIVHRDFGALDDAVVEFRAALRCAARAGDADRVTDVRASLGVAEVLAGRTRAGLATLDRAVQGADGARAGRILVRRAHAFWVLGRATEFLSDARRAVVLLTGAGDLLWEARALHHRATAHLGVGDVAAADRDYARCEQLYQQVGQQLEYATARHERGLAAFARGDLPAALGHLYDAERLFDELAVFEPELFVNKCTVLLAAGLAGEALAEMTAAVTRIEVQRGSATRRAELLHGAALAAYAAGDRSAATSRNDEALRLFRRQQRRRWAGRAELLALQLEDPACGDAGARLRRARRTVTALETFDRDRATEARLVAGRLALAAGRRAEGREHLRRAAAARHGGIRERGTGWLARATLSHHDGRTRAMLAACDRGLRVLDMRLRALGATELRSLVTGQGTELAGFALRHACDRGDARQLLEWSERWRAVVLAVPPVRPPQDGELAADLAALRSVGMRLETTPAGRGDQALVRERRRLESAVRGRVLQTPGVAGSAGRPLRSADLLAGLGTTDLVELVDVEGELYAVVASGGRVRLVRVGPVADAESAVEHARFSLRREASLPGAHRLDRGAIGRRLQQRLLGRSAVRLRGESVVVVPTGGLHAVPWALLPALRDRATAVAPSASAWLRARRARPTSDARVVLVAGPRLGGSTREVNALARLYPDAVVLTDGAATVDKVLAAMDGAWLVHIAAHGTFRADSPQFSALELDDGPLTVYDLERLARAPHRIVLANCDSAVRAPVGADELLGLVSALIALGSAGVLASVVPIGDADATPFLLDVHRHLGTGASLPRALTAARGSSDDGPRALVADSFIALGC